MGYSLVVELGTTFTSIYKSEVGIVLKEPTLVAIENDGNKQVLRGVGHSAKQFFTNLENNVNVVEPVVEGVIVNKTLASIMLQEFLKSINVVNYAKEKVGVVVPIGLNEVEKNRILNLFYSLNFNTVSLLPSVVCALAGMDIDLNKQSSHMVVVIGGGVTDIAIINGANIVRACSITASGKTLGVAISQHLRENHYTIVSDATIDELKHNFVTLLKNDKAKLTLTGLDVDTKGKKEIVVTSQEFLTITKGMYTHISNTIETFINMSSGDVVADISRYGIYVCGGMSNVAGLERFFRESLNYPVYIDTDRINTVINGAGIVIEDSVLVSKVALNK